MGKGRKGQEIIVQILCLHRRQKVKIQDDLLPLLMQLEYPGTDQEKQRARVVGRAELAGPVCRN